MSTTDESISVIQQVYEALEQGDVEALIALSDPEIEIYQSDDLPYGGRHTGHAGLMEFLGQVRAALESKIEVGELYHAGDRVVQIGRTRGTAVATGKPFDAAEVQVWGVRDGRVTSLTVYADTEALGSALRS